MLEEMLGKQCGNQRTCDCCNECKGERLVNQAHILAESVESHAIICGCEKVKGGSDNAISIQHICQPGDTMDVLDDSR